MRKSTILIAAIAIFSSALAISLFFQNHKIQDTAHRDVDEDGAAYDNPIARAAYEFAMLKNPATGTIPVGIFEKEMQQAKSIYARQRTMRTLTSNSYTYQGPNNLGGRTRAVAYDVRFNGSTNQTILAGGVSGGVFKSTDNGATWTRKSPLNQLFSVTSIAQDPRPGFQDTWYYATGESLGNSTSASGAFYLGNGIYKSTDNGETWVRLTNSNTGVLENFDVVQDLISKVAVNPTNGDVYMACLSSIIRSQDGGTTWSSVLSGAASTSSQLTDVAITSTGKIYAAFSGDCPSTVDGVWTSTTGNSGSWTRIAGTGIGVTGWNSQGNYGRVVLAIAPSNENLVYALFDNNLTNPSIEAKLFKWDQTTTAWTDLSANLPNEPGGVSTGNNPFAIQGGYDLVIAVKPDNANVVFIGGTNIYRSTDGFATNLNYKRIGGYASASSYALYANSHSDIHSIVFQPGTPAIMICGNDGGIQRTADDMATTVAWTDIASDYRTYQYYYVAMDPRSNNAKVIGGAQDNGTTRNIAGSGASFEKIISGDGGSVGLSNSVSGNTYEYGSSQQGEIYRRNSTDAPDFYSSIRPAGATDAGLFITLFKLDDDNTENLYYASDSSLYRTTSASTVAPSTWTQLTGIQNTIITGPVSGKTQITALTTTRGIYNASTASLFIGTNEGRLYRLDDPANAAASTAPVNITGPGFPGGYISSVAVNPRNDDTVLVTFSNYGVTSVFWTGNANAASPTWQNVEGNLTLPSFRSSAIAVTGSGVQYFVGTSVGLYYATIDASNPTATTWNQEGASDLGNAVVTSLAYRPADGKLLAGTHGNGMWTTTLNLTTLPVRYTDFSGTLINNTPHLKWITSDEVRNKGFEVQRSYDGTSFTSIGYVSAIGNNTSSNTYTFIDGEIAQPENYFRLKQIDVDGKTSYSSIVLIKNRIALSTSIKVLQNPFNNYIDVQLPNRSTGMLLVTMTDMDGRLIYNNTINSNQSRIRLDVTEKNLHAGTYVLQITDGAKSYTTKVIKH